MCPQMGKCNNVVKIPSAIEVHLLAETTLPLCLRLPFTTLIQFGFQIFTFFIRDRDEQDSFVSLALFVADVSLLLLTYIIVI